ncbi:winged helix-turn-helix domain-containing protein, partial [Escherichia coli]
MHPQTKITDEQLIAELQSGTTAKEIAKKYGLSLRNVYMRKARLSKKGIGHGNDAVIRKRVADGFGVKRVSALVRGNGEEVMSWVITEQDKERQLEAMRAVVEGMN